MAVFDSRRTTPGATGGGRSDMTGNMSSEGGCENRLALESGKVRSPDSFGDRGYTQVSLSADDAGLSDQLGAFEGELKVWRKLYDETSKDVLTDMEVRLVRLQTKGDELRLALDRLATDWRNTPGDLVKAVSARVECLTNELHEVMEMHQDDGCR